MSNFKAERENMIESQVRPNAVTQTALIKAMQRTPRELFVPPSQRSLAYMDGPLMVETARDGAPPRYLLSPMVFAKLAQLAEIGPEDKVLDVGAATGYSTAIIAQLAKEVLALEADPGLAALAETALSAQALHNAHVLTGSLPEGAAESGPFDVIFCNGRLGREADTLLSQLAAGGRLVAIMGGETAAKAQLYRRINTSVQKLTAFDASAPVLPGFEPVQSFAF